VPRQAQLTDVAVIGGGPAGLAAAIEAARPGARVTLVDENSRPGGQLFKQIHKFFGSEEHHAGVRGYRIGEMLLKQARDLKIKVLLDTAVWGLFPGENREGSEVGLVRKDGVSVVRARRVIVATGATENALAFPGWTLPGVMGAGAAQTLININRVLPGRRALMIGAGNVGLIVSYQLMQAGAKVVGVVEALPCIGGYHVHAAKLRRAGVPMYTGHIVVRAGGKGRVRSATIARIGKNWKPIPGTEKRLQVDLITFAVGLRPQADLCWMVGCKFAHLPTLGGHVPVHDANMLTSIQGMYVAGDIAGIEEASTALEEGRLAGVAAAESLGCYTSREARTLKKEAHARLAALRMGTYGEMRRQAKERLTACRA